MTCYCLALESCSFLFSEDAVFLFLSRVSQASGVLGKESSICYYVNQNTKLILWVSFIVIAKVWVVPYLCCTQTTTNVERVSK